MKNLHVAGHLSINSTSEEVLGFALVNMEARRPVLSINSTSEEVLGWMRWFRLGQWPMPFPLIQLPKKF